MKRLLWWALTAILALMLLGTSAFAARQWITVPGPAPADSAKDRQAVIDFVSASVPKLLSYTADTVESDLHKAAELTGGAFREYFTKFIDTTVIPSAQKQHLSTTATVAGAAVTTLTADKAELVAFVNQSTTTPPATEPSSTSSSVRIQLDRTDGKWLITELTPV